jgi:hypothetical protein
MARAESRTRHSSAREVGLRFGWRIWPGADSSSGSCDCGNSPCSYASPHPLPVGKPDRSYAPRGSQQEMDAWSLWPNAVPLLLAEDELDLVGAEISDALGVLDILEGTGSLLWPVVIHQDIAAFLVAPNEYQRWRQYAELGRGLRLLPWIPIPSDTPNDQLRWQVPPTETNSLPLPSFSDLSAAFTSALMKGTLA